MERLNPKCVKSVSTCKLNDKIMLEPADTQIIEIVVIPNA
jgi:hypothetical protein